MGDAEAPGEQVEAELNRLHVHVAFRILEPLERYLGRALQALHLRPPGRFVRDERVLDARHVAECARQCDRVLHPELRSGAHGKVGGVGGVPDQDDVLVVPACVADGSELPPDRSIREQTMSVELPREQPLAEGERGALVLGVETGGGPRVRRGLHDEGGMLALVLIRVHPPQSMGVVLEVKGEGRERSRGAQPDKTVGTDIQCRTECVGEGVAHHARGAVRAHHEVRRTMRSKLAHLGAELQVDAQFFSPLGQDLEQGAAGQAAEAVPG